MGYVDGTKTDYTETFDDYVNTPDEYSDDVSEVAEDELVELPEEVSDEILEVPNEELKESPTNTVVWEETPINTAPAPTFSNGIVNSAPVSFSIHPV